jgi:hypothetical protein
MSPRHAKPLHTGAMNRTEHRFNASLYQQALTLRSLRRRTTALIVVVAVQSVFIAALSLRANGWA